MENYSSTLSIFKKDFMYIDMACGLSHNSSLLFKHGAILVHNRKVIGSAYNTRRVQYRDGIIGKGICSSHAEVSAIRNAIKMIGANKLRSYTTTMYIARQTPTGKYAESAPCKKCAQALLDFGIRYIVYTNQDGGIIKSLVRNYSAAKGTRTNYNDNESYFK